MLKGSGLVTSTLSHAEIWKIWLKLEFDDSERMTFVKKAADILSFACLRNKGITAYRTKAGTTAKVIVIGWGDI